MKNLLITTIAAVVLVGCGESQQSAPQAEPVEPVAEVPAQPSSPPPEAKPVKPVAEAAKPTTPPKAVSANKGADSARGINPEPPTAKAPDINIHKAANSGNIEAVKQHLAAGTDVNAKEKYTEYSPLIYAASKGHKEIVKLLITKGADVNAKDRGVSSPLIYAASRGHKEIVELLIAEGADVNAKRKDGLAPLDFAIRSPEIADLLRKHGGKTKKELEAAGK